VGVAPAARRCGRAAAALLGPALCVPGSCWLTYRFAMHPVQRVPVRTGRWAGTDAGGRPVEFLVREEGRYIYDLRAPGPYLVRCSDGIVSSAGAYVDAAWIDAGGRVKVPPPPGDTPPAGVRLDAKIGGVSTTGSFRLFGLRRETSIPYGSSCDSDPISFQAAWVAPR
jgi:hypothetical protein